MMFECDIAEGSLGVNTNEVTAKVDGGSGTSRYFYGSDADAFVVFDPNAGNINGGGWFYWAQHRPC